MLKTPLAEAQEKAKQKLKDCPWPEVYFGVKGTGGPQLKRYLENVKKGRVPMTYWADEDIDNPEELGPVSWDHEESGHSQTGVNELSAVVGSGHGFETVKPLKLIKKLLQIWCPPGGTVLDPFAGSGTTGHAVLELNHEQGADRRFILIEQGRPENGDSYAKTLLADRLKKVITGKWATGKRQPLGGGYTFAHLEKHVDAQALLLMARDEMIDTVIASYTNSSGRRSPAPIPVEGKEPYQYLIAKTVNNEGVYLVWSGADSNTDLTEEVYEEIAEEGEVEGLAPFYHVYSRLKLFESDDIKWYQIPDRILTDFGLDARRESFTDEEASA